MKIPEAPFPYHMLTFHADGTVQQANPEAGNANTSDSNGMGAWVAAGERINGRFVEITLTARHGSSSAAVTSASRSR